MSDRQCPQPHETVTTPFCPQCGARVTPERLGTELLAYLTKVAGTKLTRLKRLEERNEYPGMIEAARRNWDTWHLREVEAHKLYLFPERLLSLLAELRKEGGDLSAIEAVEKFTRAYGFPRSSS